MRGIIMTAALTSFIVRIDILDKVHTMSQTHLLFGKLALATYGMVQNTCLDSCKFSKGIRASVSGFGTINLSGRCIRSE